MILCDYVIALATIEEINWRLSLYNENVFQEDEIVLRKNIISLD